MIGPRSSLQALPETTRARRAVRGGVVGNYIDQFDIFVPVIALAPASAELFGADNLARAAGLVFVATLLGRPIGAAVLGPVSDRLGRSRTTTIALAGVAVTTLLIATVPGHALLGAGSLITVVLLRFAGGVFLGGEYSAAVPLAMEWSRPRRRGLVSGVIMAMSPCANATIAALTLMLLWLIGPTAYAAWGWRVPFVLGGLLAVALAVYYRRHVVDVPGERRRSRHNPLCRVLTGPESRTLARVVVLMTGLWLMTDMAIPVLTTSLSARGGLSSGTISLTMLCATAVSAVAMAAAGHLSTGIGRARFFLIFGLVAAIAAPLTYAAAFGVSSLGTVIGLVTLLQVVTVSAYGPIGAYLAERFPAATRSSGYGIGYSVSIVLPALYPFYLPVLKGQLGVHGGPVALLVLAGALVAVGGLLGARAGDLGDLR